MAAVEAFRVARADGTVILGKGVDKAHPVTWIDRDYFIHLRDSQDDLLEMTKPSRGRVAKQYIVNFARRYNYPDGRFAGVVSAPVSVAHFSELLSSFNIGPNSTLILRDAELGLIARVPAIPDSPAGQIGNSAVSQEFKKIVDSGVASATYKTKKGADGFARIAAYRRLEDVPLVAVVAAASVDYLAPWRADVFKSGALALCFSLLSVMIWWWLRGNLMQAKLRQHALKVSEDKLRTLFELSPLGISLTDMEGHFIEFNKEFLKIFGYPQEEIKSLSSRKLTPKKYQKDELEQLQQLRDTGKYGPYEKEYQRKDGSLIPIQLNGVCVTGAHGEPNIWSFVEDISQRKQQESRVLQARRLAEEAEQFARATIDTVPETICVVDKTGTIIAINQAWRDFYGANFDDPHSNNYVVGTNYLQVCESATGEHAAEVIAWRRASRPCSMASVIFSPWSTPVIARPRNATSLPESNAFLAIAVMCW